MVGRASFLNKMCAGHLDGDLAHVADLKTYLLDGAVIEIHMYFREVSQVTSLQQAIVLYNNKTLHGSFHWHFSSLVSSLIVSKYPQEIL